MIRRRHGGYFTDDQPGQVGVVNDAGMARIFVPSDLGVADLVPNWVCRLQINAVTGTIATFRTWGSAQNPHTAGTKNVKWSTCM